MSNKTLTLYKFDDFCLDTNNRQLFYAETPVSLTPKAFQTLLVLLKNRHQVVEKEFLLNEVWADTFVEETTLSQNILTLRKTLSSLKKDKEFIVTFPRRGFRFVADVQEIVNEDETITVERNTRTHIVAEQQIHYSDDPQFGEKIVSIKKNLIPNQIQKTRVFTFVMVGLVCAFISGFLTWYFLSSQKGNDLQDIQINKLVSDSAIKYAIISPNGKYLALVKEKEANQSLSLRHIETNNTIEILPKLNGQLIGLSFSLDNEQIYYSVNQDAVGMLYKVPLLGGASQMVLKDIESPVAVSPQNGNLAFIRKISNSNQVALVTTDSNGKNEQILAVREASEGFSTSGAAWSPDGKNLSVVVNQLDNNQRKSQLAVINVETAQQRVLTNENWSWAGQSVWMNDGNGIIVPTFRSNSPTVSDEVWFVSYPDGKAKYLIGGIKGKSGISLRNDSNSVVALRTEKMTCFLSASLDNFRKSNHISTRIGDTCLFPIGADWTNDGKIVYSTTEGGNADIWTVNEDGGEKRQLTADESAEISPILSKDGKFLIFLSNRTGQMNVWRANANGTNPIQLTNNENVKETIISPDGNWVFYLAQSAADEAETLWKISINGENNQQITTKKTHTPRISPDGKTIAAYYPNSANKMSLALLSAEKGEVLRYLESPPHDNLLFLDWAKNGDNLFLIYLEGKVHSIWKLSLPDNKFEKIREWENDAIFRFVVSKDGEKVFYEVGTEINSVVQFGVIS